MTLPTTTPVRKSESKGVFLMVKTHARRAGPGDAGDPFGAIVFLSRLDMLDFSTTSLHSYQSKGSMTSLASLPYPCARLVGENGLPLYRVTFEDRDQRRTIRLVESQSPARARVWAQRTCQEQCAKSGLLALRVISVGRWLGGSLPGSGLNGDVARLEVAKHAARVRLVHALSAIGTLSPNATPNAAPNTLIG